MGSYIYSAGTIDIPKDKEEEFERNILHVFDIGGMMHLERAELFGKCIHLMKPVEPDENGVYRVSFNYFEDDAWETAGYSSSGHYVYSNKIGYSTFSRIILLAKLMQELYSGGSCLIYGDIYGSLIEYTSWINREFGTAFDLDHRTDLLHVYRVLQGEDIMKPENIDDLRKFMVGCKVSSLGALMDDYLKTHSVPDTIFFFKGKYKRNPWIGNAARWIYELEHAFEEKRKTSRQSTDEQIREALSCWEWQQQHPGVELPDNLKPFIYIALLPLDTVFRVIAYAYPSLIFEEAKKRYGNDLDGCIPFLRKKDADLNPSTQEAIRKAKCSLKDIVLCDSDDDRVYWWKEDGDFDLSEEFRRWLEDIRREHAAICKEMQHAPVPCMERIRKLFDTLFEINETYHNLFMFRSTFYNILESPSQESDAAVELLARMAHRNEQAFRAGKKSDSTLWSTDDPSGARRELKRFLGVLGNPVLRKSVFAF